MSTPIRLPSSNQRGHEMTLRNVFLILGIAGLSACNAAVPMTKTIPDRKPYTYVPEIAVSVSCVTHKGSPLVSQFYVGELSRRRMAGGGSCGGIIAAGYLLPEKWTPGMKVKVRWKPNGRDFVEKETNIIQYDEAGTIYVHFFKNDQVRVVSAPFDGPGNPGHPISMALENPPAEEQ